jgi:hypothetical protein
MAPSTYDVTKRAPVATEGRIFNPPPAPGQCCNRLKNRMLFVVERIGKIVSR